MKKTIITIAGFPGSGKSSTADLVARELGFQRFSSGDFMRKIALNKGISLNELSTLAETDTSVDFAIDEEVQKAGNMENLVIDSRLAFHWIPESFKIFLDLSPEIAKERIYNSLQKNKLRQQSEQSENIDEVFEKIEHRLESEKKRYKELYNIDHTDKNKFDLVIDTNKNSLEEVSEKVISEYKKWLNK
jgi:cytidylate kinase